MKIYTETPEGTTVVQNTFIDQYMPHANGEFVKVYLYLLRCANTGRELSLSSIADVFDHTEKDVRRALTYWENQQLLRLKLASDGTVISATFREVDYIPGRDSTAAPAEKPYADRNKAVHTAPAAPAEPATSVHNAAAKDSYQEIPAGDMPTKERIAVLSEQKDIRQLIYVAEQYLQRPLTPSEQTDYIYYYDNLKFSTDLIEYLLEYCISKGSTSRHYMRKIALSWAEAGISTVLQAKQETNLYNRNFYTVLNAFGIKGRGPAVPEQEAMSKWFQDFGFTVDIVLEACNRTIQQTHQPNFKYADKILTQWHESGVTSMSDINRLDQQHKSEQKKQQPKPQTASGNRFNNFTQRKYDYTQLEQQLLNQQG